MSSPKNLITRFLCVVWLGQLIAQAQAQPVDEGSVSRAPGAPHAVVIEAEDFKPQTPGGWRVVKNGAGNYIVDTIGYVHISGERLLSAPAEAAGAVATASVEIPAGGDYKLWARFEQPVGTENRFVVRVRQDGREEQAVTLGEASARKTFFGLLSTPEAGAPWGWQGLVEQDFLLKDLKAGPAQIELIAPAQPSPRADRNLDFLFLTNDLADTWRGGNKSNPRYPILDAALEALPARYYLRITSPVPQVLDIGWIWNRLPWRAGEGAYKTGEGAWLPLRHQDVTHFSTLVIHSRAGQGLVLHVELAADAQGKNVLRTFDWNDSNSNQLLVSLPPYPQKYTGETIQTVEEQYREVAQYLTDHPSKVGREPKLPLNWAEYIPVWERGRVGDAAADVYFGIGMRGFLGFARADATSLPDLADVAHKRFAQRNLTPQRSLALGAYRQFPTVENIEQAHSAAVAAGVLPLLQRFDYGDEISFGEWLKPVSDEEIKTRWKQWQQKHKGKVVWENPDSSSAVAKSDPELFVDSTRFYDDTTIEGVALQARLIQPTLGENVLYGANYLAHPYYYPRITPYVKWFRKTESGNYAANFGRHSEYFWQVHQPGPLVNGYIAEHFRAGMKDNPDALLLQYTMPHSPGNTNESFIRTAFTHLAHGARGLDYFGIGINSSNTENYIDFRDKERFAAIRDVNRAIALVEDILPRSHVAPSRIALILSDSTEHWDLAPIAADRNGTTIEGIAGIFANNPQVRLTYHQDRLGIYYALVNNNRPPDLLIEEDVQKGELKNYDVAYWVGDCAGASTVAALQNWVQNGGHLVATAGAFSFDEYHRPVTAGRELLGLQSSQVNETVRFIRPLIELPRLKPLDEAAGMPALAVLDTITTQPDVKIAVRFASGSPAVTHRDLGKGQITYIATLPGVAYLWSAYQPPPIASRGPSSHVIPTSFNAAAQRFILQPAQNITPQIDTHGAKIDARLLVSPNGYAIPLANYESDVSRPVTLTINGVKARKISSAVAGILQVRKGKNGTLTVNYAPGFGDILRIEP